MREVKQLKETFELILTLKIKISLDHFASDVEWNFSIRKLVIPKFLANYKVES